MKKGIALLAVVASPLAIAADMPTVYGKINKVFVNTDQEQDSGKTRTRKSSEGITDVANSESRLGAKGEVAVEGGMTATYKVEMGVNSTKGGGKGDLSIRHAEVNLKHNYGTLSFGQMYNPISNLALAADPIYETIGGMAGADVAARVENAEGAIGFTYRGRVDGASYQTPSMMGLTYTIAQDKNNDNDNDTANVATHTEHVLSYKRDLGGMDLNLYVAYDMWSQTGTTDNKDMLYGFNLTRDALKLSFAMSSLETTTAGAKFAEEIDRMFAAVTYSMNKHSVSFTYQTRETSNDGGVEDTNNEVTQMALGYKHNCTKNLDLNFTAVQYELEDTTKGASADTKKDNGNEATLLALGVQLKF